MSNSKYPAKKASMSDYKKDIINLIGIDYESINKESLMEVLQHCVSFVPEILNRESRMKSDEKEELIRCSLSRSSDCERFQMTSDTQDDTKNCQSFKDNYWRRRSGKMACYNRHSLGSFMSKKLINPVLAPEGEIEMIKCLKKYIPFKFLDDNTMKIMISATSKLSIDSGEFLIKQGDFTEKFYYVESGLFGTVKSSDKCYVTEYLKPGQCFGSDCLLFGGVSSKAIKCLQTAIVWMVESKTYHSVCHWGLKNRLDILEHSISQTPGFEEGEATRLANALIEITLSQEKDVLAATPRSSLYIVFSGEVLVEEVNIRGDVLNRTCKKGGKFGQDRIFCRRFCTLHSAKTLKNTILFYISEEAFFRLFDVLELYKLSDVEVEEDVLFYRTL